MRICSTQEKETNPRQFEQYARKMGSSTQVLMSNYAQVPEMEDSGEYKGLGHLSEEEEEEEEEKPKPKKSEAKATINSNKKTTYF